MEKEIKILARIPFKKQINKTKIKQLQKLISL